VGSKRPRSACASGKHGSIPGLAWCVVAVASTGACAAPAKLIYTTDELEHALAERVPELAPERAIPFLVDPAYVDRARQVVAAYATPEDQVRGLASAMFDPSLFGLRYSSVFSATANQTLANGEGNCMSFAAVFIGLARSLGFRAYFIDAATVSGDEPDREDNLVVKVGHITAAVDLGRMRWYLDFRHDMGKVVGYHELDDLEAIATFYNNRGYEHLEAGGDRRDPGSWDEALRDFATATRVEPSFAKAWNNLGVAYARLNRRPEAEAAYRKAWALDRTIAAPYINLGALFAGEDRLAEAIDVLEAAVKREPDSPEAFLNLGRALLGAGRIEAGRKALERATELRDASAPVLLKKLDFYRE
jgi:hypothetical protein